MILLMLDYDGTLVPIKKRPEQAVMSKSVWAMLTRLRDKPEYELAIISGRSLADIKNMVAIPGIIYAGCHGMEIESPQWEYQHPEGLARVPMLQELEKKMTQDLSVFPQIMIENKGFTLAVHYRMMSNATLMQKFERYIQILQKQCLPWFRVDRGRKVYEFKPDLQWGKGDVVQLLIDARSRDNPYPIYIGDDLTDESAFEAIQGKGLSILVENNERPPKTAAVLRLRSVSQVRLFLASLL